MKSLTKILTRNTVDSAFGDMFENKDFKLCADGVEQFFPETESARKIQIKITAKRQHRKNEIKAKLDSSPGGCRTWFEISNKICKKTRNMFNSTLDEVQDTIRENSDCYYATVKKIS